MPARRKRRMMTAFPSNKEVAVSVAKVIELTAESNESFEDAIAQGVSKAGETVRNIKSAWVKEQQVVVDGGAITAFRVDLKITFVLD
jgi:hypothetical protein